MWFVIVVVVVACVDLLFSSTKTPRTITCGVAYSACAAMLNPFMFFFIFAFALCYLEGRAYFFFFSVRFSFSFCFSFDSLAKNVCWPDKWTAATFDGKRTAQFEHTLLITDDGVVPLTGKLESSPRQFWEQ